MKRIGFVCIGNACRSQMAEGFARHYGSEIFEAQSAGLAPAMRVPEETVRVMAEKGINIAEAFPKDLRIYPRNHFDLVVNMSGYRLEGFPAVREWTVRDPYGANDKTYRAVRDQIEKLVLELVKELREPGTDSRAAEVDIAPVGNIARSGREHLEAHRTDSRTAEVDIVLIGNIARSGRAYLEAHLETPHLIREYPCDVAEAEVLVGSPVPRRMIESAPKLRLVHVAGAGYDNLDIGALPAGVALCNVFHHERAMAEYVLMTMLALDRDLFRQDRDLRQGLWDGSCVAGMPVATELAGKTLGILGYGHIGREAARLAAPFELKVKGLRSDHTREQFESLLGEADYLVVACPLNHRTRGILGAREFGLMKPTAALISIARGEVVDEQALYDALKLRRIRGAAIDVWYRYPREGEPCLPSALPFHKLTNVILTPHSSGWTERVLAMRFRDIAWNINRLARGEPLENLVKRTD